MSWISTNRLLPAYLLISTPDTDGIILGIILITDIVSPIITVVGTIPGTTVGITRGFTAAGMIRGFTAVGTDIIPTMADIGAGTEVRFIPAAGVEAVTIREEVLITTNPIIATVVKAILQAVAALPVRVITLLEEVPSAPA